MSAILKQTRIMYKKVMLIELLCFIVLTLLIMFCRNNDGIAFAFGAFSGFIPHCLLIFFVYFSKKSQNLQNLTALYQGEGIKFTTSIVLMAAVFSLYQPMNFVLFFVGFILALVLNNILPVYFRQKTVNALQRQNIY